MNIGYFKEKYKNLILKLKQSCLENEPRKVALSITLGVCIGTIPLLGITFVTITALGVLLKLNQLIIQTVHLLVSPLQVILIPVFLKVGQSLFMTSDLNIATISDAIKHSNIIFIIKQFGSIVQYGLLVWFAFSLVLGIIMYWVLLIILNSRSNVKQV